MRKMCDVTCAISHVHSFNMRACIVTWGESGKKTNSISNEGSVVRTWRLPLMTLGMERWGQVGEQLRAFCRHDNIWHQTTLHTIQKQLHHSQETQSARSLIHTLTRTQTPKPPTYPHPHWNPPTNTYIHTHTWGGSGGCGSIFGAFCGFSVMPTPVDEK